LVFLVHRIEGVDTMCILVGDKRRTLLEIPGARLDNPSYAPSGHIVYAREGSNPGVYAVPFSLDKLDLAGEPFMVDPEGSLPGTSKDGALAMVRGTGQGLTQMVWVDHAGKILETIGQPMREMAGILLSPDGKSVAVSADENNNRDVWIQDLARGTRTRLTFDPALDFPMSWSPGGDQLFFLNGTVGSTTIQ